VSAPTPAAVAELIDNARAVAAMLGEVQAEAEAARAELDDAIAEAIDLGVTQAELADALGVTRETIRRATRRAQARKAERQGRGFTL